MFNKLSLSVASLVLLSVSTACSTMPSDGSSMSSHSKYERSVRPTPSKAELKRLAEKYTGNKVLFNFDSAALNAEAQARLRAIASRIKKSNPSKIVVEGHCDERGTREYNLALGDRRAVSAKKFLVGLGVSASKIKTISYGKERPVASAHNSRAWEKNRRSVIKF